jgi:hypothetical protein
MKRIDRRSGTDRRRLYDLDYFTEGGVERRKFKPRRSLLERRDGWLRVSEWRSVFVTETEEEAEEKETQATSG